MSEKTGMPIKKIKLFIDWCIDGDSTINKRLALIETQKESVERQIEEMQKHLEMLVFKAWYYETTKRAGTCAVHVTMPESEIPEKFRRYKG